MMRHSPENHFLLLRHTDWLAPNVDGHCCLSLLKSKAKAHSRYGRDIVGSERWQQQRQPQQQSDPRSFSASEVIRGYHVCIKEYGRLVGEKPTTVRVPGNEHDRSASNAVMQSK